MAYNPANPFANLMSGAERTFNHLPNQQYAAFNYLYNPYADNGHGITGQHQLFTSNDQGALRVDIGTGITINSSFSGVQVSVGNVNVTGVTNVTGQVSITNPMAVTGGSIDVNGFATLTGQINTLNAAVATLTGSTQWNKTRTAGYASVYGALTGSCLVNKVMGYSKTAVVPGFIQLFDLAVVPTPGAIPDFVCATQPNNWYLDLAENGVRFTNGLQVVNSSTADSYTAIGTADFTVSVIWK